MVSSRVAASLSCSLYAGTIIDNDLEGGLKIDGSEACMTIQMDTKLARAASSSS